ncbi:hypothetical protein O7598_12875 [Micromonospora sp. WMMC241]|uniref:hypothetical protein n=1 Tax=Micromonospora sp. WMMC241 TaxID=3015159 RepID=UPI0022B67D42|nr:hypothetical protein [Micromonospora sp. WMMC241]MCZ7437293.1 hypothetical protein [Micromonospora sp. WMMC241]
MCSSVPLVVQVHCRIDVVVDDPGAVTALARRRLREADIDWTNEPDTIEEATAEVAADLPLALAGLVDPERLLTDLPGVRFRGAHCWATAAGQLTTRPSPD